MVVNIDYSKYAKHMFDPRHECGNTDNLVEVLGILQKGWVMGIYGKHMYVIIFM
jgi:hypothetical protein